MFTGIIESLGVLEEVMQKGTNRSFLISSPISHELKTDQSLAHNGICLTVESTANGFHQVTAVVETLMKTNAEHWKKGDIINLERATTMSTRMDGHMVQGHVDTVARCIKMENMEGSWKISFGFPEQFAALIVEKGSVCVNGISLTAFEITEKSFSVAIIPYTWEHTNLQKISVGDDCNIEFDLIGKYLQRHIDLAQLNIGK